MFIVLKKKQTLQSEKVDIHNQYKYFEILEIN